MNFNKKWGLDNYFYPAWVESSVKYGRLNDNLKSQIYVSLLKERTDERRIMLDIRLWRAGKPTYAGVFIGYTAALLLRDILDKFIKGELETDLN